MHHQPRQLGLGTEGNGRAALMEVSQRLQRQVMHRRQRQLRLGTGEGNGPALVAWACSMGNAEEQVPGQTYWQNRLMTTVATVGFQSQQGLLAPANPLSGRSS